MRGLSWRGGVDGDCWCGVLEYLDVSTVQGPSNAAPLELSAGAYSFFPSFGRGWKYCTPELSIRTRRRDATRSCIGEQE